MQYSLAFFALAGAALANPMPQGVTEDLAPSGSPPAGCATTYAGNFAISVANVSTNAKRDLEKRQSFNTNLFITLEDGVMTDSQGRTGYIAANHQFQFDDPPQTGSIYTAGWSACANGTVALGGSAIFYQCLSGNFYNLYDQSTGAQCSPIYILVAPASGSGAGQVGAVSSASAAASGAATQASAATQTSRPASQISDGQIQASTSALAVTQISDGQIQASSSVRPVSQISDGQIQATTSARVVTQIVDGQIQATTSAAAVSQISDGQIQAPTATSVRVVSQISDGQIQATTSGRPVSQISDGQIQATTAQPATATISRPAVYTGAAGSIKHGNEFMAAALGLAAVAML